MSRVNDIYQDLLRKGTPVKAAAKEAQRMTGDSLVTGKMIKVRGPIHKLKRKWQYGEYDV